jgi:hypothetical protein
MDHDDRIKAANWAMKDDPECIEAHCQWLTARKELELATRHEIPAARARAAHEAAKAEWYRVTKKVFDRVMAGDVRRHGEVACYWLAISVPFLGRLPPGRACGTGREEARRGPVDGPASMSRMQTVPCRHV